MFLHFPSLDTLRLALTSGAILESVRSSAATYALDADKSLWVQPTVKLTDKAVKALGRLGVQFPDDSKIPLSCEATHWLQMFPLARDPRAADLGDKTPVLFELTRAGQLAEVATEILRLGNDRQSFRWLGDDDGAKALLRVVGPPYYSLLRAMDWEGETREGEAPAEPRLNVQTARQEPRPPALIAYREVGPRVWIQVGYTHPLAEHLKPPAGQWLLLHAPHEWAYVPEAKLQDIYEVIDFELPAEPTAWRDVKLPASIRVPVKLTRSGAAEAAELWVLREAGIAQLEELVRSSDNALLARLAFAVGEQAGQRIVALRVRPSKTAPPVLVLDGIAFRSYLRIPNLFLPIGQALYPPLRRDAVVKLLSRDAARLTWLVPHVDGTFTPESLADDAFRPLSEWIDYVLEHEHQAIKSWLGATQFQFEGFICKDDAAKEKKPPREPTGPKQPKKSDRDEPDAPGEDVEVVEKKKRTKAETRVEETANVEPSVLEKRLRELEEAYSALKTPLEDPDRQPLWREMARLNGALNHPGDAAVCWSNALWEEPRVQTEWPREWFGLEAKQAVGATPPTAQVLRIVNSDTPTHANVRLVTAYLIWSASLPAPPAGLVPHMATVQQYLVKHETHLGIRTLWLAWHALFHLSGGDVLLLARARDRLLERLFLHGLTPELDLPGFLRFTGLQANHRFRLVRDQVVRLRKQVQDWAITGPNPVRETSAYIDLIFAFGLARLGETTEARNLLRDAGAVLANADEIHSWLYEAFEHRVQQALDGKPALDRLPASLLRRLEAIEHPDYLKNMPDSPERKNLKSDAKLLRFKIERMRQCSRILEPHERTDAYRYSHGRFEDDLGRELASLTDMLDREELLERLRKLLNNKQPFKGAKNADTRILTVALTLAPRLGQAFGEETLDRVPALFAKLKDEEVVAVMLEKSLLLAGHYDRKEDVERFVQQFHKLLQTAKALPHEKLIPLVTGSFRSLRKFGLRDAVAQLISRLSDTIAATMPAGPASSLVNDKRSKRHCLLLELAAGWLFFGEETKARKILDDARGLLLAKELHNVNQTELACAYLSALGQAPMDFALSRIMEFFRKVEGVYDMFTTQDHYSLTRFNVVEAMILAIISDDFTLDREARKRLDDEYLVRRRIHRDVRAALA